MIHLPSLEQFSTVPQFIWLQSQIYVSCFARQQKQSLIQAFKSIRPQDLSPGESLF